MPFGKTTNYPIFQILAIYPEISRKALDKVLTWALGNFLIQKK